MVHIKPTSFVTPRLKIIERIILDDVTTLCTAVPMGKIDPWPYPWIHPLSSGFVKIAYEQSSKMFNSSRVFTQKEKCFIAR